MHAMGLDLVEYIMKVEDRFGVTLPPQRIEGVSSLGGLADALVAELIAPVAPESVAVTNRSYAELQTRVWQELRRLTAEYFAVPAEFLSRQTRFIEDLDAG